MALLIIGAICVVLFAIYLAYRSSEWFRGIKYDYSLARAKANNSFVVASQAREEKAVFKWIGLPAWLLYIGAWTALWQWGWSWRHLFTIGLVLAVLALLRRIPGFAASRECLRAHVQQPQLTLYRNVLNYLWDIPEFVNFVNVDWGRFVLWILAPVAYIVAWPLMWPIGTAYQMWAAKGPAYLVPIWWAK